MADKKITVRANQTKTIVDEIELSERSSISQNLSIYVKRNAKLQYIFVYFGGKKIKSEIEIVLDGEGANANILGIIFGHSHNTVNLKTNSLHRVPNTYANIFIKGVVKDTAQLDYRGLIKIGKCAQKTNSCLSDHTLILNKGAKAIAVPSLEIEADDVRASHGATLGKLDKEQIFYLMSRGLNRKIAEKTLVQGFLNSVVEKIEDKGIRNELCSKIEGIKL